MLAAVLFDGYWRGWTLLLAVTPVVPVASVGLAWLNRKFVEPLRNRVRRFDPRSAAAEPPGLGVMAQTIANQAS